MIHQTLNIVRTELEQYLFGGPLAPPLVVIANAAKLDDSEVARDLAGKLILTLVNIEEEKTLKNNPSYVTINGNMVRRNPSLHLNLYVLITANFGDLPAEGTDVGYNDSLLHLYNTIEFFQQKYVFDKNNTPLLDDRIEKLIFDIHTMNFEYLNHLWGILGGKYYPSVLYRIRLMPVQANNNEIAPTIREIETTENAL